MKRTTNLARHGDLSFRKVSRIPKGLKTRKSMVLAEGEFTGHSHKLVAVADAEVVILENGSELFIDVKNGDAEITHEEHGKITLAPGKYKMIVEREYDYFLQEARRVMD